MAISGVWRRPRSRGVASGVLRCPCRLETRSSDPQLSSASETLFLPMPRADGPRPSTHVLSRCHAHRTDVEHRDHKPESVELAAVDAERGRRRWRACGRDRDHRVLRGRPVPRYHAGGARPVRGRRRARRPLPRCDHAPAVGVIHAYHQLEEVQGRQRAAHCAPLPFWHRGARLCARTPSSPRKAAWSAPASARSSTRCRSTLRRRPATTLRPCSGGPPATGSGWSWCTRASAAAPSPAARCRWTSPSWATTPRGSRPRTAASVTLRPWRTRPCRRVTARPSPSPRAAPSTRCGRQRGGSVAARARRRGRNDPSASNDAGDPIRPVQPGRRAAGAGGRLRLRACRRRRPTTGPGAVRPQGGQCGPPRRRPSAAASSWPTFCSPPFPTRDHGRHRPRHDGVHGGAPALPGTPPALPTLRRARCKLRVREELRHRRSETGLN